MAHPVLQQAWDEGRPALGTLSGALSSDASCRALASAGYDFVAIDCQHGILDETGAGELLRRSADLPCAVLVRVRGSDWTAIGRVLDAGADGVIVPMVCTVQDARAAVAACRYQPTGVRSFGPGRPDLGVDVRRLEARVSCLVMIETEEALAQAREIAAVPGVAGLFVGPYDLGIALGVAFEEVRTSPVLASALRTVREACDEAGIVAGCFASGAEHAARVIAEGYRMVSLGGDATLLINAARSELEAVRGRLSGEVVVGYGG